MDNIYIKSIGYYVPDGRLTNEEAVELLKQRSLDCVDEKELDEINVSNLRKLGFLGIKTRSIYKDIEEDCSVNMAVKACQDAIDKAQLEIDQIDCIIISGIINPFREPSFANVIAKCLGARSADFFDINDTCNGFMKSIEVASLYIKSGKYKNILIGTCENPYESAVPGKGMGEEYKIENVDEMKNKFSMLICGSGAAAMIISADGDKRKIKNYAQYREIDTWDASWYALPYQSTPPTIYGKKVKGYWTDARRISTTILRKMPVFVNNQLKEWGKSTEDIDYFVLHQLGDNITFGFLNQLNVSFDKAPVNTFSEFGNIASANVPINLAIAEEKNIFKPGDSVLLVGSGGGLSMIIIEIEW